VNERRQRAGYALATSVVALGLLTLASACDVGASIQGVQTAVTVAQTIVPGAQTALPGFQATAQAGATVVAGVLSDPQALKTQLQVLLAGVSVDLKTTPPGVANDAVTDVSITGTDERGTVGQLDSTGRQAAAGAALLIAAQYFPNATISLSLADPTGSPLLSGTKAPGQAPTVQ
jgi:hypothetical protein